MLTMPLERPRIIIADLCRIRSMGITQIVENLGWKVEGTTTDHVGVASLLGQSMGRQWFPLPMLAWHTSLGIESLLDPATLIGEMLAKGGPNLNPCLVWGTGISPEEAQLLIVSNVKCILHGMPGQNELIFYLTGLLVSGTRCSFSGDFTQAAGIRLTKREIDVLNALIESPCDPKPDIALRLNISQKTLEAHMLQISRKLGLPDKRMDLTMYWLKRKGLLNI